MPFDPCDLRRNPDCLSILEDYLKVLRLDNVYLDLICKVKALGDSAYILMLDNDLNELKSLI